MVKDPHREAGLTIDPNADPVATEIPPQTQIGEPAPWFVARSNRGERFAFSSVGGRYVALCFFLSLNDLAAEALAAVRAEAALFTGPHVSFLGVSTNPMDRALLAASMSDFCLIWDDDLAVSKSFGAAPPDADPGRPFQARAFWLLLDPQLRILARHPLSRTKAFIEQVAGLPPPDRHGGVEMTAPVLIVPRVFEPEFCATLIGLYERHGGSESVFMRQVGDQTVGVFDHRHKRRRDYDIEEEPVREAIRARLRSRLLPEITKAFNFAATRIERFIVACYDAAEGGHFRAHRDNTTLGTAHRRFAVTINLNTGAYDGGELWFPEYGSRTYVAPAGGAVVFSCSLLHEAAPVRRGQRFACLPFLYDDAAAKVRSANLQSIVHPAAAGTQAPGAG